MSIRNMQIKKAVNNIIKDYLEGNIMPTERDLSGCMYDYFNTNEPGLPTFQGLDVGKKSLTNFEEYGEALDQIEWDLDILFKYILQKNEQLINKQIDCDIKRKKIIENIEKIKKKIQEITEIQQNFNNSSFFHEYKFEDYNNYKADSTAFLDLKFNNLKLSPRLYQTSNRNIENITLEDISPGDKVNTREINQLNNAKNDYKNESWIMQVEPDPELKDEIDEISVSLLVELANNSFINQIELASNTREEEHITIQLSEDNNEWQTVNNVTKREMLEDKLMYYFKPRKAKYAHITITKEFTEIEEGKIYIFSLENLSFYNMQYDRKNYLESNPRSLPSEQTIDKIELEAEEYLPEDAKAKYYINIFSDDSFENYEKHEIVPVNREGEPEANKKINLFNTSEYTFTLQNNRKKERVDELDRHNKRFYRANEMFERLPLNIIPEQTELFKGVDQWSKEVYQKYRPDQHRVSIEDWTDKPVGSNKIITNYHGSVGAQRQHRVRQFIDYTRQKNYYPLKFRYITDPNEIEVKRVVGDTIIEIDNFNIVELSDSEDNLKQLLAVSDIRAGENEIIFIEYPAMFLNYKFTRYFYCNEAQPFTTKTIYLPEYYYNNIFEKDAFYLNNRRMPRVRDINGHYFRGHVSEGWNRIDYLCYINSPHDLVFINEYEDNADLYSTRSLSNIRKFVLPDEDYDTSQLTGPIKCFMTDPRAEGFLTLGFVDFAKEAEVLGEDTENHVIVVNHSRAEKESMNYTELYSLRNKTPIYKNDDFSLNKLSQGYDLIINTPVMANYKTTYRNIIDHYTDYNLNVELNTDNINFTPEIENIDIKFTY